MILASSFRHMICRYPVQSFGPKYFSNCLLLAKRPCTHQVMVSSAESSGGDDVVAELAKKKCVPCKSKDLRPMTEEMANELLGQVPEWSLCNEEGRLKLHRSWKAKSFVKGLEFFKRVADVAEAEGHHPDLHLTNWNNVSIDIWTHATGGLTENDFILAAKISILDVSDLMRKGVPKPKTV